MSLSALKVLLALGFDVGLVLRPSWFLAWLPFTAIAGAWVTMFHPAPEWAFAQTYMELAFVLVLFVRWIAGRKDRDSVWLLAVGLAAAPSLLGASGHFGLSAFLFLGILAGPGVFRLFRVHAVRLRRQRVVDLAALAWIAVGIFTKFYNAADSGQDVLLQRGGGIWGSNHVGGLLILLLPFATSRWVVALGVAFLAMNFSRGIYVALVTMAVGWFVFVSRRQAALAIVAACMATAAFLQFAPADVTQEAVEFATERLAVRDVSPTDLRAAVFQRAEEDERWSVYDAALRVAYASHLGGVGLGGFVWALPNVGYYVRYSNAHNLYLTALAEGGVLFAVMLVLLLIRFLVRAYAYDRRAFVALLTWGVYGLFSGEIYEAAGIATSGDYYTLIFVLAMVATSRSEHKRTARSSSRTTPEAAVAAAGVTHASATI